MKTKINAYFMGDGMIIMGEIKELTKPKSIDNYVLGKINNFESTKKNNSQELLKSFYERNKKVYETLDLKENKNFIFWTSFDYLS